MSDVIFYRDLQIPQKTQLPDFVPPPRFGKTYFADYDPQHPTQAAAADKVQAFIQNVGNVNQKSRWFWQAAEVELGSGVYLDGGFGVGKTHLLASAYHASDHKRVAYLSFQELVYTIGFLGKERAKAELTDYDLYCIDEFELDDPGNTLIVKTFLAEVFAKGHRVLTTSNTPPEAQGQGRFNANDFKREIQSIAERFEVVRMEGPDYRQRHTLGALLSDEALAQSLEHETMPETKVVLEYSELLTILRDLHPIRYISLLKTLGSLYVRGMTTLEDQNDGLRLAHFIDKVYDLNVGFRASSHLEPHDIYHPSYRTGAFAKKYERSLSRLSELLEETF